eukprot:3221386-Lingulodinium_polyedra.AAC.1
MRHERTSWHFRNASACRCERASKRRVQNVRNWFRTEFAHELTPRNTFGTAFAHANALQNRTQRRALRNC